MSHEPDLNLAALLEADYDPTRLRKVNSREKARFLLLISEGFSVAKAAEALNKPRLAFANLIDNDPTFRELFDQAFEASADKLEDEAWRRAHERGRHRLGSDRLLELGLKARRPGRYGDKVQVGGVGGGPIKAAVVHVNHAAVFEVLQQAGLLQPGPVIEPSGDAEAA